MDQPLHDLRPFQDQRPTTHRFVSIGMVVLLHVIAIYALASGLAQNLIAKLPQEFKAEVIPQKQEVVKPPPPPPPELQKPPPPFVPPPEINIQTEAEPNTITVQKKYATPPPPPKVVAPPPKPSGITQPVLVAARGADCNSEYPPIAVRLNQTGETTVTVQVDADGHPSNVSITNSSGHDSLDQAAVRCVNNHWHFKPAMQDGRPVPSAVTRIIKWQIQG